VIATAYSYFSASPSFTFLAECFGVVAVVTLVIVGLRHRAQMKREIAYRPPQE
jgi:hypothetical protein